MAGIYLGLVWLDNDQEAGCVSNAERDLISLALKTTEGNTVQAAALLRISRKKLYAKIEKYGL